MDEVLVLHVGEDGNVVEEKISFKEAVAKYSDEGFPNPGAAAVKTEPTNPDDLEDEDEQDDIEEEMHELDTHIGFEADSKYAKLIEDHMDKCDKVMGAIFRKKVISHSEMAEYEKRFLHNLVGFMKKMSALYPGLAHMTSPLLKAVTWQGLSLCRALVDTRRTLAGNTGTSKKERPAKKQRVQDKS